MKKQWVGCNDSVNLIRKQYAARSCTITYMICRMWRGWTQKQNADAYQKYLNGELFPRVEAELKDRGFRGFHLLKLSGESEVEFVTMLWFDSIDAVRGFAGENYETPVIHPKAQALLSRYADRCDHYDLTSSKLIV